MYQIRSVLFTLFALASVVIAGIAVVWALQAAHACNDLSSTANPDGIFERAFTTGCVTSALLFNLIVIGMPAIFVGLLALFIRPPAIIVRAAATVPDLPVRSSTRPSDMPVTMGTPVRD